MRCSLETMVQFMEAAMSAIATEVFAALIFFQILEQIGTKSHDITRRIVQLANFSMVLNLPGWKVLTLHQIFAHT